MSNSRMPRKVAQNATKTHIQDSLALERMNAPDATTATNGGLHFSITTKQYSRSREGMRMSRVRRATRQRDPWMGTWCSSTSRLLPLALIATEAKFRKPMLKKAHGSG